MNKILLLEDEPQLDSHFRKVFGDDAVDAFRDVGEIQHALRSSTSWNFAFLDFSLGESSRTTGLSAFALLREQNPRTKLVGLTNVGENSRPLFAVAAHRWFGMWGLVHKPLATAQNLLSLTGGNDRMPGDWEQRLAQHGGLVDQLFAHPRWGRLWQMTLQAQGIASSLATLVEGETESFARKSFVAQASLAAINFSDVFLTQLGLNTSKPQLVLVDFVRENYKFFTAPDLLEILDVARPWDRIQRA